MEINEQLIIQNILLNSKMTFSSPEQAGILAEVKRIRVENPELTITEIANAQVDKIKEVRGLKNDFRSRIQGEINVLLKKASSLSDDCVTNEDEIKEVMRQIDNLKKQR